jgi:hypothetical protein
LINAFADMDLKNFDLAKANLDRALPYVKEGFEKDQAERLKAFLIQPTQVRAQASAKQVEAPRIARAAVAPPSGGAFDAKVQIYQGLPSVEGTFLKLLCEENAKIVLKTPTGNKTFVIEDPTKIVVTGKAGGKADLSCGDQSPVSIKIEYAPAPEGSGADGAVRNLFFE